MYSRQLLPSGQFIAGIRRDDGLVIAEDPDDPLWQAYLAWCAAGNVATDPTPVAPAASASVTNYQARAVMRQFKMPDGRSLFTTVDSDLRAAVEATKVLDEFDPQRVEADLSWQAWEQANTYDRQGAITQLLAGRYGFDEPTTDELFRKAEIVTA
jgi:hypothetical protein